MSNFARSEGEFLWKLIFLFQICPTVPRCQTYHCRTVHAYRSLFSFSYFLGIPDPSTLLSESGYSYSLESLCFPLSKRAVPWQTQMSLSVLPDRCIVPFLPYHRSVWRSWKHCVPSSPPPPSQHGLPANLFFLKVGLVTLVQLCQELLRNCNRIWSDCITEGKTDLYTFCFLKTHERGLRGSLKRNSNMGP